mmetsp:Transcript_16827/g.36564  ORF Transcript_16827/g.36564 Transcript_16827/m.36564 type:complete len:235 (+) Transcript_16827:791-1495(+)
MMCILSISSAETEPDLMTLMPLPSKNSGTALRTAGVLACGLMNTKAEFSAASSSGPEIDETPLTAALPEAAANATDATAFRSKPRLGRRVRLLCADTKPAAAARPAAPKNEAAAPMHAVLYALLPCSDGSASDGKTFDSSTAADPLSFVVSRLLDAFVSPSLPGLLRNVIPDRPSVHTAARQLQKTTCVDNWELGRRREGKLLVSSQMSSAIGMVIALRTLCRRGSKLNGLSTY